MHSAHAVGQTVGGGARRHVVRVEGSAGAAAGGDGEVFSAVFHAPFLIGSRYKVLEAGGVRGVAGDGNIHALALHNGYALAHVVCAIAADSAAFAVGELHLADNVQLVVFKVKIRFHIGEAVHTGNNIGGVLAQTVQNNADGGFTSLVGVAGDTDCALRRGKGLMPRKEREALRFFGKEHGSQVAVTESHAALFGDGAGNAERLQALAYAAGGVCGGFYPALNADGGAQGVRPHGVFKGDGLNAFYKGFNVNAGVFADFPCFFKGGYAVFGEADLDFRHSSFFSFKFSHYRSSSLILLWGRCTSARRHICHRCRCSSPWPPPGTFRGGCPPSFCQGERICSRWFHCFRQGRRR